MAERLIGSFQFKNAVVGSISVLLQVRNVLNGKLENERLTCHLEIWIEILARRHGAFQLVKPFLENESTLLLDHDVIFAALLLAAKRVKQSVFFATCEMHSLHSKQNQGPLKKKTKKKQQQDQILT